MNISIVGLGYVGAVSAACLADSGHRVWGVDINPEKVRIINQGCSPIVESGLADKIAHGKKTGLLCATTEIEKALRETELSFIAVATPSRANGQIDPSHLFRACNQIAAALAKLDRKQTVVIRSSVLPSIFDECKVIFESKAPGLVELCTNPEFLREGTAIRDFEDPPFTILGTQTAAAEQTLRSLYSEQSAQIVVLEPREALMVKYASNAFHSLKVAFSNEIAAVCEKTGVDAAAVMNVFCQDTKLNISRRYLMPGFAFGGSCLPKDLRAILHAGKECDLQLPLIAATLLSNQTVIERAYEKVRATGKRRIGLVGLSFKSNTDDLRESPFVELAERLLGKGYELRIYDPNVIAARLTGANKEYIDGVIPHLSRLLVPSLEELNDVELLIIGHHFDGVSGMIENTRAFVIDLNESGTSTRGRAVESELVIGMGSKRNILIIVQNLPVPFDRRVWQEATSLRRHGFGVAVICPKKGKCTAGYERLEDVDIYRYPLIYEANKGVAGYFFEFVYCWLASLWLALRAYAHRPFQAIHACNPPDTFFALALLFRPLGVKFVFDHHDLCPEMYLAKGRSRTGMLYRALLMLERMTLRSADAVIAVNESHRTIALQRGGIPDERITVVRSGPRCNWADIHSPSPELKRGRRHMVLYLGEMCEQDGVDHLLRAIEGYRTMAPDDTLFAFVGGGPDQPRMKAKAEEMGLGPMVHFAGRIPDEDLWAYLSTADLCVDPDPFTEWSNMSTMNKIIEYMAFGRPIVAFDLVENRRSAESAAVYVEGNDDAALGRKIRELLLDVERRRNMSQFGRTRFREELAWENSEQRLIATYRQLLDVGLSNAAVNAGPRESVTTDRTGA